LNVNMLNTTARLSATQQSIAGSTIFKGRSQLVKSLRTLLRMVDPAIDC